MSENPSNPSTARRVLLIAAANVVVVLLLLALLEGAASLLFTGNEILRTPGVPEHTHADYDDVLGWANRPDVRLADFYGAGIDVHTNSRGFRGDSEYSPAVPAGKVRVVCSGDSFTFGYAVGDDDAWCARLASLDPRLETVNMGLGGYGVDQAYLWYMRDGVGLEHQIHLFVFLADDFRRMRSDRFMGYGKPLLGVRGDSLAVVNYPVPRTSWFARRAALHGETIARLNVVRLARRVFGLPDQAEIEARAQELDRGVREVVPHIFADLQKTNLEKGSTLVLVFLPGVWDYQGAEPDTDEWRAFVRAEADRQGIAFIDLVEDLRRLPPTEVQQLYGPHAHFTVAGNDWAARSLYERLLPLLEDPPADGTVPAGTPRE